MDTQNTVKISWKSNPSISTNNSHQKTKRFLSLRVLLFLIISALSTTIVTYYFSKAYELYLQYCYFVLPPGPVAEKAIGGTWFHLKKYQLKLFHTNFEFYQILTLRVWVVFENAVKLQRVNVQKFQSCIPIISFVKRRTQLVICK